MAEKEAAILYFKHMRQVMCENDLRTIPKKTIAYKARIIEKKFYDMAIKALEQMSCEDAVAKERYEDLCEYFGGAKDILKNQKDFKAWLERIKWHIHKAEELYEKYECKESCEDAISRQAVINEIEFWFQRGDYEEALQKVMRNIKDAKSVRPKREKGEWIKTQLGTVCNKCYRFPLVNKDENEILSNYCPYCGADMKTESEVRNER